jgi:hypothetical protein
MKTFWVNDLNDFYNAINSIHIELVKYSFNRYNMTTIPSLWYRGQANSEWHLIPSIQRNNNSNYEQVLCHSFYHGAKQIMEHSISKSSYYRWLSLMQHYGLPTRMLDWTYSPMVSLFFAVNDNHFFDKDASIFVLIPELLNKKQGFDPYIYPIDSYSAKQLIKPAFKKRNAANKIIACFSTSNDLRLYAQRAAFTIHDSNQCFDELCDEDFLFKINIHNSKKSYFKEVLNLLDFNESILFPDLSHIASQAINRHLNNKKENYNE